MQHQTELFAQFFFEFSNKHPHFLKIINEASKSKFSSEQFDEIINFIQKLRLNLSQFSFFELALFCTQIEKTCLSIKSNQIADSHSYSFLAECFAQLPSLLLGNPITKRDIENQNDQDNTATPLIYVVDDEPMLLELFEAMLQVLPIRIKTFNNPEKAVEDFLFDRPALILSDMKMPEMTGSDLLKKIRALDQSISFIFISGYINKDNVLEFMNLGVYGVVEKPFKAPQVIALVEKALKHYQVVSMYNQSLERVILKSYANGNDEFKILVDELIKNRKNLFLFT